MGHLVEQPTSERLCQCPLINSPQTETETNRKTNQSTQNDPFPLAILRAGSLNPRRTASRALTRTALDIEDCSWRASTRDVQSRPSNASWDRAAYGRAISRARRLCDNRAWRRRPNGRECRDPDADLGLGAGAGAGRSGGCPSRRAARPRGRRGGRTRQGARAKLDAAAVIRAVSLARRDESCRG